MIGTYEVFTKVDGKSDSDEILSILAEISTGRRKNDLRLVNYYQEMPISYGPVEIDDCSGGALELTVHQNQIVVVANQKQTILKSKHFPDGLSVHAVAESVNIKKCYVVLGRFAYAGIKAERRAAIRVRMQGSIPITFKTDRAMYSGVLVDISISGVKVKDSDLPSGPVNGIFGIPLLGDKVSLPGTFIREKISANGHFHAFTIEPDSNTEGVISKMIYSRQIEIIQMLKDQILLD